MKWLTVGSLLALAGLTVFASDRSPLPGDPDRGRAVFLDRELGHCLLCHQVAQLDAPFQGNIGPDLSNVADRLPITAIRERIVDPTQVNPETVMPSYGRTDNLIDVDVRYQGKPILDASQLNDVVAFVATLRQPPVEADDG